MVATINQTMAPDELMDEATNERSIALTQDSNTAALLLPSRIVTHHKHAGLNPLVDAAGYLFSMLGKVKHINHYRQLGKLQSEFIQEVNLYQETVKHLGFSTEYTIVCRYVLCAVIDDIIANTTWGGQGQWDSYSLLVAFNQDVQHQDKFFSIMERAINEPASYIDLMELMYICLSLGYKGKYRSTEYSQYQLEQITNNLYKHIRAYRGSFSKALSPTPLKIPKPVVKPVPQHNFSFLFLLCVTASIILAIFISLGYLMDAISNEAFKNIAQIQNPTSSNATEV